MLKHFLVIVNLLKIQVIFTNWLKLFIFQVQISRKLGVSPVEAKLANQELEVEKNKFPISISDVTL